MLSVSFFGFNLITDVIQCCQFILSGLVYLGMFSECSLFYIAAFLYSNIGFPCLGVGFFLKQCHCPFSAPHDPNVKVP